MSHLSILSKNRSAQLGSAWLFLLYFYRIVQNEGKSKGICNMSALRTFTPIEKPVQRKKSSNACVGFCQLL